MDDLFYKGLNYLLRSSISEPICPAAISRNAVTVGLLLRMSSTSGVLPFSSWRARRAAIKVKSKWLGILVTQSSTVIRAIFICTFLQMFEKYVETVIFPFF
ncbi:hypothetical protein l11_22290 [Neisseria weaveri LMG 5135]|nr:hypothetical protein l11_22290 [Neisseria weaveri LMG 5135]